MIRKEICKIPFLYEQRELLKKAYIFLHSLIEDTLLFAEFEYTHNIYFEICRKTRKCIFSIFLRYFRIIRYVCY